MNEKIDVLAVIRRHAESHRAMAESDAYSAQEAPRLEAALVAIAELIEAAELVAHERLGEGPAARWRNMQRFRAALARVGGGK